jgi:hypothetical protein
VNLSIGGGSHNSCKDGPELTLYALLSFTRKVFATAGYFGYSAPNEGIQAKGTALNFSQIELDLAPLAYENCTVLVQMRAELLQQ